VQLKQVHYFLAICKDKSFTRAAKRCGVAQPTITMGIQRLEAKLGADLFVRQPALELSPFGIAMRPAMEQLARKYESLLLDAKTFAARK
jgi:DNA-binding transcriptional LysR family regulator